MRAVHGHQHTKFGEDISNSDWFMAIFFFSKWRPTAILDFDTDQKWRYGTLRTVHIYHVPNFVTVNRRLSYCVLWKNSKWRTPPFWICIWQFWIIHEVQLWTWSLTENLNRTFTVEDIVILRFLKFGLNAYLGPKFPKIYVFGVLTHKCYFSLLRPQKGTSLAGNTRFESSLVTVRRAVRPGSWAKSTKNKLEIWGGAQREAARRRKSDWRDNFGGSNSARSNATWRIKVESYPKSRRNSTWVGQRLRL